MCFGYCIRCPRARMNHASLKITDQTVMTVLGWPYHALIIFSARHLRAAIGTLFQGISISCRPASCRRLPARLPQPISYHEVLSSRNGSRRFSRQCSCPDSGQDYSKQSRYCQSDRECRVLLPEQRMDMRSASYKQYRRGWGITNGFVDVFRSFSYRKHGMHIP